MQPLPSEQQRKKPKSKQRQMVSIVYYALIVLLVYVVSLPFYLTYKARVNRSVHPVPAQAIKPDAPAKKAEQVRLNQVAADYQHKIDSEARAKLERKAGEEYDSDGLVLLIKTITLQDGDITGTVVNRRRQNLDYVDITFLLYDKTGAQVGTAFAHTDGLKSGASWTFKASTFGIEFIRYKFTGLTCY